MVVDTRIEKNINQSIYKPRIGVRGGGVMMGWGHKIMARWRGRVSNSRKHGSTHDKPSSLLPEPINIQIPIFEKMIFLFKLTD